MIEHTWLIILLATVFLAGFIIGYITAAVSAAYVMGGSQWKQDR